MKNFQQTINATIKSQAHNQKVLTIAAKFTKNDSSSAADFFSKEYRVCKIKGSTPRAAQILSILNAFYTHGSSVLVITRSGLRRLFSNDPNLSMKQRASFSNENYGRIIADFTASFGRKVGESTTKTGRHVCIFELTYLPVLALLPPQKSVEEQVSEIKKSKLAKEEQPTKPTAADGLSLFFAKLADMSRGHYTDPNQAAKIAVKLFKVEIEKVWAEGDKQESLFAFSEKALARADSRDLFDLYLPEKYMDLLRAELKGKT
jgi:hypothetical protein